jgi:hypothetical protein
VVQIGNIPVNTSFSSGMAAQQKYHKKTPHTRRFATILVRSRKSIVEVWVILSSG